MKPFYFTKLLAVIMALLTIFATIGYVFLAFIGYGLGRALNSEVDTTAVEKQVVIMVVTFLFIALLTAIGSFWLRKNAWRVFYIGFCFVLGVGCVGVSFFSIMSTGIGAAILIVCIGIGYLWLGYLALKRI
ncbi:hypothetical protein KO561_03805 [Radiobacillus kanasensis]|uniref:hypothetical protein n=1 Tax=Radiobacillus kanasensis TaxID=2844358 RepID=UPI001E54FD83|nr:hypothetical protein [Radiobacillus kanasensis]UFU00100.1 hypothetical protein KO561_03805 [Radiobacillus kanasensis]